MTGKYLLFPAVQAALIIIWFATGNATLGTWIAILFSCIAILNLAIMTGLVAMFTFSDDDVESHAQAAIAPDWFWFVRLSFFAALAWGGFVGVAVTYFAALVVREVTARILVEDDDLKF